MHAEQVKSELNWFFRQRIYCVILALSALGAYGFEISHPAVGIDDTAIELYFEEGLAPAMGRWVLYLVNKVVHIADFAPWLTELAAVLIFCLSVTLWCVLFRRILGDQVSIWGYALFAGMFITCPLISEVFVYYLHNGICIGYGATALSLLFVLEAMERKSSRKKKLGCLCGAVAGMAVSVGCYESLMIVYISGMFMVYYALRMAEGKKPEKRYSHKPMQWIVVLASTGVGIIIMREVILRVLQWIFKFHIPENYMVAKRSIFENMGQNIPELIMALKKFWVMYYVNGIVYLPITVLVIGFVILAAYGLFVKRDGWAVLAVAAMMCIPVVMVVVEGYPTHYRASQYVPLAGAFAVLVLCAEWKRHCMPRGLSKLAIAVVLVLIYNQCADMNQWFYVDYLKYQDALETMRFVAYELEKEHDMEKPIVFRGAYKVPDGIAGRAYCRFDSWQYQWIRGITDMVDIHLKEKFYGEAGKGYVFAETPVNSTLQWGITAFDGTSAQIMAFLEMHGITVKVETNLDKIREAEEYRNATGMPAFPEEGFIVEREDYIIVNLGN